MLPARFASGGGDLLAKDDVIFERLRGSVAAMIFQEPMLALDPVFTIGHSPVSPSAAPALRAATSLPHRPAV
jgi:ABC-type microcin C transport system duplicated ATPase subunit YejF